MTDKDCEVVRQLHKWIDGARKAEKRRARGRRGKKPSRAQVQKALDLLNANKV